jgi:hypothetical protein
MPQHPSSLSSSQFDLQCRGPTLGILVQEKAVAAPWSKGLGVLLSHNIKNNGHLSICDEEVVLGAELASTGGECFPNLHFAQNWETFPHFSENGETFPHFSEKCGNVSQFFSANIPY